MDTFSCVCQLVWYTVKCAEEYAARLEDSARLEDLEDPNGLPLKASDIEM